MLILMGKHAAELSTKTDQIRNAWAAGDRLAALRIASRFHDRSPETIAFKRGWDAHSNAGFYRQLGRDPDALRDAAYTVLAAKFGLPQST